MSTTGPFNKLQYKAFLQCLVGNVHRQNFEHRQLLWRDVNKLARIGYKDGTFGYKRLIVFNMYVNFKNVFFVEPVLSFLEPFQILTLAEKIACYHSITRRKNCQSRKARRLHSANSSSNSGRYPHLISHTPVFIEIRKELKNSMSPFILIATAMFAQSYGFFDFWQSV